MRNHQYHERLNTHGMVLDRRADIEHHNTMINTMKSFLAYSSQCQTSPTPVRPASTFNSLT
jgi:hypothetical protein